MPPIEPAPGWRRALPLVVWMTCLAVAVALLFALGNGRLAAPSLSEPGSWQAWAAGRDPLEVVMVVLRLAALAVAWYLTGVTSISVIARLLRAARLVRVADALSVGPVKVLVQQALGISLAAGVVASSLPGVASTERSVTSVDHAEVAVMAVMESQEGDAKQWKAGDAGDRAVMIPVPAPAAAGEVSPSPSRTAPSPGTIAPSSPSTTAPPAPAIAAPPSPPTTPTTATMPAVVSEGLREVRVESGDHFWGLAEQAVAGHLGRPGSEQEVVAHWQAMLVANADRLAVAGNPDLLLPGQVIVVPDVAQVLP